MFYVFYFIFRRLAIRKGMEKRGKLAGGFMAHCKKEFICPRTKNSIYRIVFVMRT